MITNRSIDQ